MILLANILFYMIFNIENLRTLRINIKELLGKKSIYLNSGLSIFNFKNLVI